MTFKKHFILFYLSLIGLSLQVSFGQNNGTLETSNGILLGNNSGSTLGTIRWNGSDFEGRKAGGWASLTSTVSRIQDSDNDTYVDTELTTDTDIIYLRNNSRTTIFSKDRLVIEHGIGTLCFGNNTCTNGSGNNNNTAFGINALENNTGEKNSAFGGSTLNKNTTGENNSACGVDALENNTTGQQNSAFGNQSLSNNTTGNLNTAAGYLALINNITGDNNTALGYNAGPSSGGFDNTTALGRAARTTASNQVRLGNNLVTSIGGQVSWTTVSDNRFKINVKEDVIGLDFITQLRPVNYTIDLEKQSKFIYGENDKQENIAYQDIEQSETSSQTGFIAQEVHQLAQELGFEFSGVDAPKNENDYYGLRYGTFVVPLVKAVQELDEENSLLLKKAEELNKLMDTMQAEINSSK